MYALFSLSCSLGEVIFIGHCKALICVLVSNGKSMLHTFCKAVCNLIS